MMGPLVWLVIVFYYGFKQKTNQDKFLKSLKFVLYGTFIFFLCFILKRKELQAQWPLIEFIVLCWLTFMQVKTLSIL
jgi:hypothetical protein